MFHVSHYVRLSRVQYAYLLIPSPSSWPQNDSSQGIWFELLCQRDWVWYSSQLLHSIAIPWRNPSTRAKKEKYIIDRCLIQGQRQETQMEDGYVQQILLPKASTMAGSKRWAHSKKPISRSKNIPNTVLFCVLDAGSKKKRERNGFRSCRWWSWYSSPFYSWHERPCV